MPECTVLELAQHLADQQGIGYLNPGYALFLGAGASIESGIDGTAKMTKDFHDRLYDQWINQGSPTDFPTWLRKSGTWDESASDYSNYFDRCEPEEDDRERDVEGIIAGRCPGSGYFFLSQLMEQCYFDVVVTTNFDDLVYEACARWTPVRPRVYGFGAPGGPIRLHSGRAAILKLHGDYLYSNIKITGKDMKRQDPNMKKQVDRLKDEYHLIIVGYGGNDKTIMNILKTWKKKIYWCVYKDEVLNAEAERLLQSKPNWFKVQTNGFESVMGHFLHAVRFVVPDLENAYWKQKDDAIKTIMKSGSPYRREFLWIAAEAAKDERDDAGHVVDDVREWVRAFLKGFACYHKKNYRGANKSLRHAFTLRSEYHFIRAFLGHSLTKTGLASEAIDLLENAPDDADIKSALGRAYTATNKVPKAIELLNTALKQFPEHIEVAISLSEALTKDAQLKKALDVLIEARRVHPDNVEIVIALSEVLRKNSKQDDAVDLLKNVWENRKGNPNDADAPDVADALNVALKQTGKFGEALELLSEAHTRFRDSEAICGSLGAELAHNDRVGEGIEILRKASEKYHENVDILGAFGFALLQGGQTPDAIACLRKALKLHQDDDKDVVLTDLGLALSGGGPKEQEEAKHIFQGILGSTPYPDSSDFSRLCWRGIALLAVRNSLKEAQELFRGLIMSLPQTRIDLRDVSISLKHLASLNVEGAQEILLMVEGALQP